MPVFPFRPQYQLRAATNYCFSSDYLGRCKMADHGTSLQNAPPKSNPDGGAINSNWNNV